MNKITNYILLVLCSTLMLFTACNSNKITSSLPYPPTQTQEEGYVSIPIYYATNRDKVGNDLKKLYGGNWTKQIKYGYYLASIPETHQKGKLEQAGLIEKMKGLDFNPSKYINILKHQNLDEDKFHEFLFDALKSEHKDQAFIFIHGYNNTFESAALRTAQLFYDLEYKGIPIMYSWPSTGKATGYFKDGNNIEKSTELFQQFIKDVAEKNPEKKLNIIAHSMGNRLLVETISKLQDTHPSIKFENIIMAAPDVSKNDFDQQHSYKVFNSANHINLYCSKKDKALNLSKVLNFERRLGLADSKIYIKQPLKTVDVTEAGDCEDILSHTCFAQTSQILDDLKALLNGMPTNRKEKKNIFYLN